jgi:hypothetical protein
MSRAFRIILALILTPPLTIVFYGAALVAFVGLIPFGIIYCPFYVFNKLTENNGKEETD